MNSNKTSILKIKEHLVEGYNNYPKEVQKAAKYLISNTFEIPVYSLRKISKKAEVSPSTLIRLVRMLGFERYDDFKTVYIEEAKNSVSHFTLNAQKIQKQKTNINLFQIGEKSKRVLVVKRKLRKIGYKCSSNNTYDLSLKLVVEAFQRRFLPDRINGIIDTKVYARITNVSENT